MELPTLAEILRVLTVGGIFIALLVASRVLLKALTRVMLSRTSTIEGEKRVQTVVRAIRYLISVTALVVCVLLVLSNLGISIAPLLGAAGVVGIAVGFAAQNLIKDYFSGFFLLIENQIRVGDVVEVAGKSGLVEEVTLRHVRLRDYEGRVHFVPNGSIDVVTNSSWEFANAVIDVGVAYKENIDRVFDLIRRTAEEMFEDPAYHDKILDALEIAGVNELGDSSVVVRARVKVKALEQWGVRRELLRRIKATFDKEGIEIPFPHMTVYTGSDKNAPPSLLIKAAIEKQTAEQLLPQPDQASEHTAATEVKKDVKRSVR